MTIVTGRHITSEYLTLMAALPLHDRELVIMVPTVATPTPCVGCLPALGPVLPAHVLLRYTATALRVRRRRIALCRACWAERVMRVLAEGATDVRVYVPVAVAVTPEGVPA